MTKHRVEHGREIRQRTNPDLSWLDDAACQGMNSDLWFSRLKREQEQAKQVCRICSVRDECAEFGKLDDGIWGGETLDERRHSARIVDLDIVRHRRQQSEALEALARELNQ